MRRHVGAWLFALCVLAACAESKTLPRTQITLVVRAEPGVEQDAGRLTIAFRTGDSRDELADAELNERFGDGDPGSIEWPVSLALIRSSGASIFEVQIEALDAAGDVIARRVVQSGFAQNETKLLEVVLERLSSACLTADCEPSENCSSSPAPSRSP